MLLFSRIGSMVSWCVAFLRVGREDASSRQDIVLSGHFIKEEHCTFTSTTGPMGEGLLMMQLQAHILVHVYAKVLMSVLPVVYSCHSRAVWGSRNVCKWEESNRTHCSQIRFVFIFFSLTCYNTVLSIMVWFLLFICLCWCVFVCVCMYACMLVMI